MSKVTKSMYLSTKCNNCDSNVLYYIYSKRKVYCKCTRLIGLPTGNRLRLNGI